jgi:hypothetical protein
MKNFVYHTSRNCFANIRLSTRTANRTDARKRAVCDTNNYYIKHFFINCQIKKLQPIFDTFVPPCILI